MDLGITGEKVKILIVEDDENLAFLISSYLEQFGYETMVSDGRGDVLDLFRSFAPYVVLLDIGLPGSNGYYWCDLIRRESRCPILFVSAQSNESDQILALMRGGDDFICKPFSYDVLKAKINALLRRAYGELAAEEGAVLSYGDLRLSERKMTLSCRGRVCDLTKTELMALRLLISEGGCAVSRSRLLNEVWDDECFVEDNTLTVVIGRLRKRLACVASQTDIRAIRGVGYKLETSEDGK